MFGLAILILVIVMFLMIVRKDYKNPLMLFCVLWISILLFYNLRLYNLYDVNFFTTVVVACGVISFCIGYLFIVRRDNKLGISKELSRSLNIPLIKGIILYTFFVSLPFNVRRLSYMITNNIGPNQIKWHRFYSMVEEESGLQTMLERPFEIIIIAVSAYFLVTRRNEIFIILSGIYFVLMKFVTLGSRFSVILYVLAVLLAITSTSTRIIPKKFKKRIFYLVIVSIVALMFFIARYNSFFETIYVYLCGCIQMLNKVVDIHDGIYDFNTYTCGFSTCYSFWRLLWIIIKRLGLGESFMNFDIASAAFEFNEAIQNEYTDISPTRQYNAFVSFMGPFYVDFGIVGVIILSIVFGAACACIFNRFRKYKNLYYFILFFLVMYAIMTSMVRFQFSDATFGLALLYTVLLKKPLLKNYRVKLIVGKHFIKK